MLSQMRSTVVGTHDGGGILLFESFSQTGFTHSLCAFVFCAWRAAIMAADKRARSRDSGKPINKSIRLLCGEICLIAFN